MTTLVLTGLPGTGKTRLALAVAAALAETREVRLLPTDAVKAVLRAADPAFPRGAGYLDPAEKARRVHVHLAAQAAEAAREGFVLVVEGTLAAGFRPAGGLVVRLVLDGPERARRVARKPAEHRRALAAAGDLAAYRAWLAAQAHPDDLVLDAAAPVDALVATLVTALDRG
jgi:hypothetical protein